MNSTAETQTEKLTFLTEKGESVDDYVSFVKTWLKAHPNGKIYVGSDSKVRGNRVKYSTVICLWDVGRGVWEAYANQWTKRPPDRFTRLWAEVTRSVNVAEKLRDLGAVHVHMDINSKPGFASHQLYDAGMGLATSMGFMAAGKPDAWAATSGANRHCQ